MTPSGIDPATFRFVALCLNHCDTACPQLKGMVEPICVAIVMAFGKIAGYSNGVWKNYGDSEMHLGTLWVSTVTKN
jgi:hypothetical protein